MKTPDAQSLVGPGRLKLLPHDPWGDRRVLTKLAADCERFSPAVALEDAEFPEALLLEVTGLAPLWGSDSVEGEKALADAVQQSLRNKRLKAAIAIAPTPGLALAATRYAEWIDVAARGSPLVVIDHGSAIDRLPVEALRLDQPTIEKLRRLGVETVGTLRGLPRPSLPARFGSLLALRLDQLTGEAPEPLVTVRDAPLLVASWPYETPVSNGEALSRTVEVLLLQLSTAMRDQRCGALRVLVTYELDTTEEAAERLPLRLFRPTSSAQELHELVELHSSRLRIKAPVRAIHIRVGATAPLESRQQTLFDDDAHDDPHETALLINRLASRIGFDRVSRVERRRSIDAERSFALVPATDCRPERFEQTARQSERARRLPLAMSGSRGEPIEVLTDGDAAPVSVRWRGVNQVIRCWGPERVETGWWRGRGVRRDAYWVELNGGCRLWLTVDLRSRRWRLAGEFA